MPNHCYNTTTFSGPKDEIDRLITIIQGAERVALGDHAQTDFEDFGLKNLIPMPSDLANTVSTSGTITPYWKKALESGEITQEEYDAEAKKVAERAAIYESNRAKYGYKDWYEWASAEENWGTKWGDYDHYGDSGDEATEVNGEWHITYTYQTAWGPFSDTFWRNVSMKFPTLTISTSYEESGMCFMGAVAAKNGVLFSAYAEDAFPDFPDNTLPDGSEDPDWDEKYMNYLDETTRRREEMSDRVFSRLMDKIESRKAGI